MPGLTLYDKLRRDRLVREEAGGLWQRAWRD